MPRMKGSFETFGDGILTICEADERTLIKTKMEHVRFGNKTIGVQRFWQAKTAGNKVDRLISMPLSIMKKVLVEVNDVVLIETEGKQYIINQVQPKFDARPPALYLSMEQLVHPYKDKREKDEG